MSWRRTDPCLPARWSGCLMAHRCPRNQFLQSTLRYRMSGDYLSRGAAPACSKGTMCKGSVCHTMTPAAQKSITRNLSRTVGTQNHGLERKRKRNRNKRQLHRSDNKDQCANFQERLGLMATALEVRSTGIRELMQSRAKLSCQKQRPRYPRETNRCHTGPLTRTRVPRSWLKKQS